MRLQGGHMNGLTLKRWAICGTFAVASSVAQAATYSVSSQSNCQAIPGALWSAGNVCTLGADFTLRTGDTLTIPFPATLTVPTGVTLTNNGGLVQVQVSGKLLVSGGTI